MILITHQGKPLSIWGSLTRLCKAYQLPYHSIKMRAYPITVGEFELVKLPKNTHHENENKEG